ncbi:hypothetical protein A9R01_08605 ['Osedax' symbiont bacterium Rs2_46_30_T18]|nr:hypothetical protein A9R01_08605 ['Osedax' symbiont bacterium Rs2_46_30_T18]
MAMLNISSDPSRGQKRRLLLLILIMSLVVTSAVGVAIVQFYADAYEAQRNSLTEQVRTQAHLIDSIARFDRKHSNNTHPRGWKYATLSQVVDSYLSHEQLGGRGEMTIARREGNRIVFMVRSGQERPTNIQYVPFDSSLAEPMRQALLGRSGTVVGPDYLGVEVLAAHAPLAELGWGIVAKVAVSKIKDPIIRVSVLSAIVASILIISGALMFQRVIGPLINNLEAMVKERTESLEKEIAERYEAEEHLKAEMSFAMLRRRLAAGANKAKSTTEALEASIELLCSHSNWRIGHAFLVSPADSKKLHSAGTWYLIHGDQDGVFRDAVEGAWLNGGEGLPQKVLSDGRSIIAADVTEDPDYVWADLLKELGVRGSLVQPIRVGDDTIAVLEFFSEQQIKPSKLLLQTLDYATDQLGRVFERQIAEEKITHLATHDALTGLPSLKLGVDRLSQSIRMAERSKTKVGLMFMDLDGFKLVNDTHGHAVGDQVLKEFGALLVSTVRAADTVARIGGDEFIVVLPELDDRKGAKILATKVIALISSQISYRGLNLNLGVSIGISIFPDHGVDASVLLKQADNAMYESKNKGKNGFTFAVAKKFDIHSDT